MTSTDMLRQVRAFLFLARLQLCSNGPINHGLLLLLKQPVPRTPLLTLCLPILHLSPFSLMILPKRSSRHQYDLILYVIVPRPGSTRFFSPTPIAMPRSSLDDAWSLLHK